MEKKRILVFIGGSYVSGLEISTLNLVNALRKDGNDVRCVINGWNDGVFKERLRQNGIPWYEVKLGWLYLRKPLWTLDTLVHWPRAFLTCKKTLKDFKPDICHFAGYAAFLMLFPLMKGRKCIYNLQEPDQPTRKNLFIYKLLNRRINVFTTVSNYIVRMLRDLEIPEEKIRLIYNGVPPATAVPAATVVPPEKPSYPIALGIIGQIVPWKGHETLIDAVEQVARSFPNGFIVHIFGNEKNEYAGKLKLKIASRKLDDYFDWKGFISEQSAIYSQMDIAVVPSLSEEPCSLSILESMMWKRGVIVSNRGGNPELITHEQTGFIFDAGDPSELAAAICSFLREPSLIGKMGKEAGRVALEKYSDVKMKEEYLNVYSKI